MRVAMWLYGISVACSHVRRETLHRKYYHFAPVSCFTREYMGIWTHKVKPCSLPTKCPDPHACWPQPLQGWGPVRAINSLTFLQFGCYHSCICLLASSGAVHSAIKECERHPDRFTLTSLQSRIESNGGERNRMKWNRTGHDWTRQCMAKHDKTGQVKVERDSMRQDRMGQ